MIRVLYDGRTITELREWARELQIPGRTRMNGEELSAACNEKHMKDLRAKEDALIESVGQITIGTRLQYADGTRIIVTGEIVTSVYGTRYVTGDYIFAPGGNVEAMNRSQDPGMRRHYLYALKPVLTTPKMVRMMCCNTRYATVAETFFHECTGTGPRARVDLRTGNIDNPCPISGDLDCVDDYCPLHRRDIDGQKEPAEMLIQDPRGSGMGYNLGGGYVLGEIDRTGV